MSARVLAVDDDPVVRGLVAEYLGLAGYTMELATDGAGALAGIAANPPDVVVCDVQMPGMDGFEVLQRLRAEPATTALPFVLLTSLSDGDSVRRGLRLGADDFLSKPVRAPDLAEAVGVALDKRRRMSTLVSPLALPDQDQLRERYAAKLEGGELRLVGEAELAAMTGRRVTQTVLFSDIRGFTTISERLPVIDVAEFLSRYLREACKPIVEERGRIMKIMGDGIMAIFGHETPEDCSAHAAAALRAGLRLGGVAQQFRHWIASRFDLPGLPPFDVGVGIHTGEVMLFQLPVGSSSDLTAVGDTVNVASRLEAKSKELGWPVVASEATLAHAGPDFLVLERREVELAGRGARMRIGRVVQHAGAAPRPEGLSSGLEAMVNESARVAAESAKQALDGTLHALDAQLRLPAAAESEPLINGYRVLKKIAEGGMSSVYLAQTQPPVRKVVLKVLKGRRNDDEGLWRRFFQECAILSGIQHPNVVRIYDQGFGEELAYLAMEYLGRGTLRDLMQGGVTPRQALSLLSQAAGGLAEIHRVGIVHRDIKPANLMLRDEGVLVLTDFGVAKRLDASSSQTSHGEILGTPNYISPEQAQGSEVTPGSDLYSLGVIFFEMLTGHRPFTGGTLTEILAQHISAPVPRLPEELAEHQCLVDGMLAKRPAERFESADSLLAMIDEVWTRLALKRDAYTA
jgi:class 3 adenylate cyclase/CheY-like chemotaxis protein/tRNA A-37 threonylcarbamoyl transferase component Bud32